MSDHILGPKVEPAKPEPGPEWTRVKGTNFEINAKGQKRTWIPANEAAHGYGWPNYSPPVVADEDNT